MTQPPANPPHWTARSATIATPCARRDVQVHALDDEAVVVDPRSGAAHRLNATALWIWRRCDGGAATRDLAADLSAQFSLDFDDALDDVEAVILTLAERDLFEEAGA